MNRFKTSILGSAALCTMLTFSLVASAKLNKAGSSTAGFKASGPAGLNIDGKTSDLTVADDGTTVTLTVTFANIDTGISLRNTHTKKYLEADKYPTAELKVPRSALKFPAAGAESSGDAKGTLKVHGVTKDVTLHYSAKANGDMLDIKGSTRINIKDYGIEQPGYLGVNVKTDVEVYANFQAKDN
jgi:polyisoprenoid-binding protein YceI